MLKEEGCSLHLTLWFPWRNTFQIMCPRCKLLKIKIQPQYIRFGGTHIRYGCGQLRTEIVNPLKNTYYEQIIRKLGPIMN